MKARYLHGDPYTYALVIDTTDRDLVRGVEGVTLAVCNGPGVVALCNPDCDLEQIRQQIERLLAEQQEAQ